MIHAVNTCLEQFNSTKLAFPVFIDILCIYCKKETRWVVLVQTGSNQFQFWKTLHLVVLEKNREHATQGVQVQ